MKVEIIEEEDVDYGPVLYVHVGGKKQRAFVVAKDKNARETVLKATIAELQGKIDTLSENTRDFYDLKFNIRKVLKAVGAL